MAIIKSIIAIILCCSSHFGVVMRKNIISTMALTVGLFAANSSVVAATDTTSFKVKITVQESCKFTNAKDISFDVLDRSTNVNKTADGQLDITCTLGTPYKVALAGNGKMIKTGSSSSIAYNLYQDSNNTVVWDQQTLLSNTGDGASQKLPVYAKLSGNTNVEAGDYLDTVVATVTY